MSQRTVTEPRVHLKSRQEPPARSHRAKRAAQEPSAQKPSLQAASRRRGSRWMWLALGAILVAAAVAVWESDWMLERQAAHASPEQIRAMAERMPGSAIVQYHLARTLKDAGDMPGAVAALERARAADPQSARVVTLLADLLERQARFSEAGALVEGFARSHPRSSEAHYALGVYLYRVYARPRSVEELQLAVRLAPEDARAWRVLGEADMALDRFTDAERAYSRALDIEPNDAQTLARRGIAYRSEHNADRAEADVRAAVRLDPKSAELQYILGETLAQARQTLQAEREAERILTSLVSDRTMSAQSHRELGRLYSREGRWHEAERELAAYVSARPEDSDGLYQYAVALRHDGKPDAAALQRFRAVKASEEKRRNLLLKVQNEPANVRARLDLARLLADRGEVAFAILCYERALRQEPGNTSARDALAALQSRMPGGDARSN